MLTFAYDGSINGEWVSHYAIRLAANHPEKRLHLVHVQDGLPLTEPLEAKLDRIRQECEWLGVELDSQVVPLVGSISKTIRSYAEAGADHFLVCGLRARVRRNGLLSGTISEQLLRYADCNVMAVRIVQPGLLGCPRRLLLPLSDKSRDFRLSLPFLKLLAADVVLISVLCLLKVAHWRIRLLSSDAMDQLRHRGQAQCERVEHELYGALGQRTPFVDANSVVSDDVPNEIVLAANRTKSQLIYISASGRNLTERFLYGNPIEQILRHATCDVAIYRGVPWQR